jgi:putative ABC transport system permease protein
MLKRLVFSWLDFKVGFRMLARYPGLTIVGTVAIAIAIALGSLYFEGLNKWENPRLPSPDADRIVSIRNWDVDALSTESRSLYDYAIWRDQAKTLDHIGAAVPFVRNLATDDRRVEPVSGADISPNAFGLLETAALLGRSLSDRDAQPSEPPVVVISYALWKARFDGDPGVVGRAVRLGTSVATIVGVMPEGFGFPVSQRIWAPLRLQGTTIAPRSGPTVSIFARLAPGKSMEDAQTELGVIGARIAASNPETHKHLKPRVTAYAKPLAESGQALTIRRVLYTVNAVFLMLLAVICANVATLVFARTATRSWELTVRTALGASRARIISQLFIEALVLSGIAAVVGLLLAKLSMRWALRLVGAGDTLPYWINDGLSWKTLLYAAALTLFGAAIVGILPALKVTRVNVQDALRSEGAATSGLRFGGFWTTIIVVQIAITVAFLPLAAGGAFESNRFQQRANGIGAQRYLSASVDVDREQYGLDSTTFAARARLRFDELERRVAAEPGVERVTFADRLPVQDQFKYQIEVDTATGGPKTGLRRSALVQVSRGFFSAFGTSVIAGRDFTPVDYDNGRVLLVNESFVRNVLGGRNPIGQRIRVVGGEDMSVASRDWYEIIGTVKDFGWQMDEPQEQSAMYRPHLPVAGTRVSMAVRVSDPATFGPKLRTIALQVDPTIRLTNVQPLADIGGSEAKINWALTSVLWIVSFIVLLLSATGIHSLMSFTVARRTREIGIRTALGASSRRIVGGIFSRAFIQMAAGLVVGSGLAALLGLNSARDVLLVLAADGLMLVVGLTACAVPLRRALRIDPTEALRSEG